MRLDLGDCGPLRRQGFARTTYSSTFTLVDLDGDKRARVASASLVPARRLKVATELFTNALGWEPETNAATIGFADINADGRPDVCGRGVAGLYGALTP